MLARRTARTLGALGLFAAAAPVNAAVTGAALVSTLLFPPRRGTAVPRRTILVSGGKMTKSLALCRAFHSAGHRVVLVETAKYRLTGHRFSRSVDAFHVVPPAASPGYAGALLDVVQREGVDVYVPVCAPAASLPDARAKALLSEHCEVLHLEPEQVELLDDKAAFARRAGELGLRVPDTHRITDPQQVLDFDFTRSPRPYILKSIAYDPVHRLDLTRLPLPPAQLRAFVADRTITPDNPWILQEFVAGQEYCTHSTVRDGRVKVFLCCESSAFQINYAMVDVPAIRTWVEDFVAADALTGQVSFDFMVADDDGEVYGIECNPRTHSAITMLYDHPGVAAAYLDHDGVGVVVPTEASRPTYWIYHELWRLLVGPSRLARVRTILAGKDAIFDRHDPLPFLLEHHLAIPALLLRALRDGGEWIKIDVNIGKLVEPAGD